MTKWLKQNAAYPAPSIFLFCGGSGPLSTPRTGVKVGNWSFSHFAVVKTVSLPIG